MAVDTQKLDEQPRPTGGRTFVREVPLPPDVAPPPNLESVGWLGPRLAIGCDTVVQLVDPNGNSQTVELDGPVLRLASGVAHLAVLCGTEESASVVVVDGAGRARTLVDRIERPGDVAVGDDAVVVVHGPTVAAPATATVVEVATGRPTASVPVAATGRIRVFVCDDGTVVVVDVACARWWWIQLRDCVTVDEGEGSAAVPCGDDDTTTGHPDGKVTRPGLHPCTARLGFPVGRLLAAARVLAAQSRDGRLLTLLDRDTLETRLEHQFGRGGAAIRLDSATAELRAFDFDRLRWLDFDLAWIFRPAEGDADGGDADEDSALFIGRSTQPLIADRATALGDQRILAIPLLEPGQVIGSGAEIRAFIQDEIVAPLGRFYRDASYDQLRLSADVYGFEGVAAGAGPLTLLHPFETFWNGELEEGGFRIRIPDVASPHRISFDGTEELVVQVSDTSRGITDQELTLAPSAARLTLADVIDGTGAGTVVVPAGSVGVFRTDVDGVVGALALRLLAGTYTMPAELDRFETDVNAELDAAWTATGADPVRRLRARCRLHTRDRDVHVDLVFANASTADRWVERIEYAGFDALDNTAGAFFFSDVHGRADTFELERHLELAGAAAELDAGLTPGLSRLIRPRIRLSGTRLSVAIEMSFTASVAFVRQARLENLGLDAATTTPRGFEGEVTLPAEAEPLRFDGSERATIVATRGGMYELRVPALRGIGPVVPGGPPPTVDFTGTTGTLSVDGIDSPLTFPAETVATDPASLQVYLDRVLASATHGAPHTMTSQIAAEADGRVLLAVHFTDPPPGGTRRRVSLTVTDGPALPAFFTGLLRLTGTASIRLDTVRTLEDELDVAVRGLPFLPPDATLDGFDIVVEFTFDRTQAGSGNSASVTSNRGLGRYGFDSATPIVGNDVEVGRAFAPKPFRDNDGGRGLGTDFVTALHRRHAGDIGTVLDQIRGYHSVMLVCIGAPPAGAGWTSADTSLESQMRAFATGTNIRSRDERDVAIDHNWFVAILEDDNDLPTTAHEFGHAIGLYDLYLIDGVHRPGLRYFEDRCLMDDSSALHTICGYHKLGADWVPRPVEVGLDPATTEALVVPLEYHGLAPDTDVRAAFDGSALPVTTLVRIGLGSGAAPFGLVEARQRRGSDFGQRLLADGGVLVSHCLDHSGDIRLRDPEGYRRQAHPLATERQLDNVGDEVELGALDRLPIGGTRVEIVDRRAVTAGGETFNVFRVGVVRQEAPILDLFFQDADPPWRAPDAWVDDPDDADGIEAWPVGEPRTQGDTIRVPDVDGLRFPHLLRARVHNGSRFEVPRATVRFYLCGPPGSGDDRNFVRLGESDAVRIPPGGTAIADLDWATQEGDQGHQCLRVELFDWELPAVPPGDPGFSDDIREGDNQAQKNFDSFQTMGESPYEPVGFGYSLANDGPDPEYVRLQADDLPPGIRVEVWPAEQWIAPDSVGFFRCELTVDEEAVQPGCASDRDFALTAWRRTGDAWQRWGGCQYLVQPRRKTTTVLDGSLAYGWLRLSGTVTPSPGFGQIELQVAADDGTSFVERVGLTRLGLFELERRDVDWDEVTVVAAYRRSPEFGASTSEPVVLRHVRLI